MIVGYAGIKLTVYGDAISDKTGLGGNWAGFLLIGLVTSIPELTSGVSAVTLAESPDLAIGAIFGACIFNLAIIVIIDLLYRGDSIYHSASPGHVLSASFGMVIIGLNVLGMFVSQHGKPMALGHVGVFSVVVTILYLAAVYTVFEYERHHIKSFTEHAPDAFSHLSLASVILRYLLAAAVVIVAGITLPLIAKQIALMMRWQESFVGTLLVGFITTVPEIAVAVTAVKISALDMAIGSIFGSNLLNNAIIAVEDIVYQQGPIFTKISPVHAVSALTALIMTGFAVIGFFYRPERRIFKLIGVVSWVLLLLFLINSYFMYVNGHVVS